MPKACEPVLIALGSPFHRLLPAAISPPAALCGSAFTMYLLFLIGLYQYTTFCTICQEGGRKNLRIGALPKKSAAQSAADDESANINQ